MTFIEWLKENKPEYTSYAKRKELAKELGISNYSGTAEQNQLMWKKLKLGVIRKKSEVKENTDLTSIIEKLGYIPEAFEEAGYGIDPALYEKYPSEAEYKAQKEKSKPKIITKNSSDAEMKKWASDYYDWATINTGGNREAKDKDVLLAAKYLPEEKASILRNVYNLGDEKDYVAAENRNIERLQQQGVANFPNWVRTGMIRPNHFLDDVKNYLKKFHLTDDVMWNLINSAQREFQYAAELHTAGSNMRRNKEIEAENFIREMHNAQNEFLKGAGSMAGNLLNTPSHLVYGGYKALTDPNYSTNDFVEGIMADSSKNISASNVIMPDQEKGLGTTAVDILFDPITLVGGAVAAPKLFRNAKTIGRTIPPAVLEDAGLKTTFRRFGNNMFNVASGAPHYRRRGRPVSFLIPEDEFTRLSREHYLENISPTTERVGLLLFSPTQFMPGNLNYIYLHGTNETVPGLFDEVTPIVNPLPTVKQISFDLQRPLLQENEVVWPEYNPQETTLSYRRQVNPDFERAFAKARKNGEKTFMWNGKIYGTGLDPNYNLETVTALWKPGLSKHPELGTVFPTEPIRSTIIDGTLEYGRSPRPATVIDGNLGTPAPQMITIDLVQYKQGGTINYLKHYK